MKNKVIIIALAAFTLALSANVTAMPKTSYWQYYFKTSALQEVVGAEWRGCVVGSYYFQGEKTEHWIHDTVDEIECPKPIEFYQNQMLCMTEQINTYSNSFSGAIEMCMDWDVSWDGGTSRTPKPGRTHP